VIQKIGSGAYGHVYKVQDRKTKKIKALKKNFDAFNNSTDAQRTYREIMFLMELKHPNIITLDDIIQAENGKDIYLVFEFMDADLHLLIRENILTEKHKKYILYQTAKAVLYLHSAGLIHRDLKPSNILLNEACDAKLCDFGLVRSIDDNPRAEDKLDILTEYIATRWYRAPELLLGSGGYSKGIDVWGFGCLAAEMIKGKPLFPGTSTINQLERVLMWTGAPSQADIEALKTNFGKEALQIVLKTKKVSRREFFNEISYECLDLISKCL
jgi:mitogen-activated protein kinase 15